MEETITLDTKDLLTLETVLSEKKAHIRPFNESNPSEFFIRISLLLSEVREKLGWD